MKSSTRRVVDDAVGRQDDRAQLRAELRGLILAAAEPARERGAVEFHFARELTEGVPLSVSLAVFVVRADLAPLEGMPAAMVGMTVADATDDEGRPLSIPMGAGIQVTRRAYRRAVPQRGELPAHDLVQADYWVSAAAPARIAVLSFSTAFVELEEDMLQLFDAIVQTIRWSVTP